MEARRGRGTHPVHERLRSSARAQRRVHRRTGALYRSAHARIEAGLAEQDATLRSFYVLASLSEFGRLSQQDVCDRIVMDRSDMVRLIDDLKGRGLVVRNRDLGDRRRYQLTITPAGETTLAWCQEILARVTDDIFAELTDD